MVSSVKDLLAAANAVVPKITPADARRMMNEGNALVVDVRDASELQSSGKVKGALNISRGMLEFRADPDSPYFDNSFEKNRPILVYCASGGRAALTGRVLQEFGYQNVHNLGAFKDWVDSGGDVDR
jgi:rhodanese-related sulfurtransferase